MGERSCQSCLFFCEIAGINKRGTKLEAGQKKVWTGIVANTRVKEQPGVEKWINKALKWAVKDGWGLAPFLFALSTRSFTCQDSCVTSASLWNSSMSSSARCDTRLILTRLYTMSCEEVDRVEPICVTGGQNVHFRDNLPWQHLTMLLVPFRSVLIEVKSL